MNHGEVLKGTVGLGRTESTGSEPREGRADVGLARLWTGHFGPGSSLRSAGDRGLMLRGGATSFFSEREASDQTILKLTYGKKRTEIAQMV